MTKIGFWWILKGEDKVKKIIGEISKTILYLLLGLAVTVLVIGLILHLKWMAIFWLGGIALVIFMIHAAVTWTD